MSEIDEGAPRRDERTRALRSRRAGKNAAMLLSAVACLGCLVGGVSIFLDGKLGFAALLAERARAGWPVAARVLIGIAALAAVVTAILRVDRATWRESVFGAAAWLSLGLMLGAWAGLTPATAPSPMVTYTGLFIGIGAGLALRFALGWRGASQGLRDGLLAGVTGAGVVWTASAFGVLPTT